MIAPDLMSGCLLQACLLKQKGFFLIAACKGSISQLTSPEKLCACSPGFCSEQQRQPIPLEMCSSGMDFFNEIS